MKRRTLDFIFVVGGVVMAILLGVLGLVLRSNANFAKDYVKRELSDQKISFTPAASLVSRDTLNKTLLPEFNNDQAAVDKFMTDNNLVAEADAKCLVKYGSPTDAADRLMTTGKQAECYANYYIRLHATDGSVYEAGSWATDPKYASTDATTPAGMIKAHPEWQTPQSWTYATIGQPQSALRTVIKAATANGDPKLADYQAELDSVTAHRSTLQTAETLRGLLLTSYGFSVFGEKADLAALVCYLVALVLLLASIAGLIHASKTPPTQLIGHAHVDEKVPEAVKV